MEYHKAKWSLNLNKEDPVVIQLKSLLKTTNVDLHKI